LYGRRISFGRATGRYWSKILSALMLFAGFWVIPLTQRKQGLHDLIASTLVGRRDYVSLLMPATPLQPAHPQNRPGGASEVQGAWAVRSSRLGSALALAARAAVARRCTDARSPRGSRWRGPQLARREGRTPHDCVPAEPRIDPPDGHRNREGGRRTSAASP